MIKRSIIEKFESKEIEERFIKITRDISEDQTENMNTLLDPQPVGCSADGTECRIRFVKKDWEKNQREQVHGGAVSEM